MTSGQASADASDKLAHLQAVQSLKTKVAAAVEAAKTAGKGDDTTGTSDKGGGQGAPAPAPGDTGKDKGDEGSQPSSGGNIPTEPATTTSTSTDDMTDRNGQHHPVRGHYPRQQRQLSGQRWLLGCHCGQSDGGIRIEMETT